LGVVPFYAFGASTTSDWYRISVGTIHLEALPQLFVRLEKALVDLR
jgi:aspartate aminotransferase